MASSGLPEGWSYEPEDRLVGIFGDAFVHETCALEDALEATQVDLGGGDIRLECACGATVDLEYDGPDEDPRWDD